MTWSVGDVVSEPRYDNTWVTIWNIVVRLAMFLVVVALLSNLRRVNATQRRLALSDPLTGVSNARDFEAKAHVLIAQCAKRGVPITVGYLDLDDFKTVNDALGHRSGDEILRRVATALDLNTRSEDVVARLGGDEFGLLCPATGSEAAKELLRALVERLMNSMADLEFQVGFSAGAVTLLTPPPSLDDVIVLADDLMYKAKRKGKGTFEHRTLVVDESLAVPDITPPRTRHSSEPART